MMRTRVWALALAALIGFSTFSIPQTAEAGKGWYGPGWKRGWGPRRGWGPGPYWGAGAVGLGVATALRLRAAASGRLWSGALWTGTLRGALC
jgi:hypothetical protein